MLMRAIIVSSLLATFLAMPTTSQACYTPYCTFLAKVVTIKSVKRRLDKLTFKFTIHILKRVSKRASCKHYKHLLGTLQHAKQRFSLTRPKRSWLWFLRRHITSVKVGEIGLVKFSPQDRRTRIRWVGWKRSYMSSRNISALLKPGITYKKMKKRFVAAENRSISFTFPRKITTKDVHARFEKYQGCQLSISTQDQKRKSKLKLTFKQKLTSHATLKDLRKYFYLSSLSSVILPELEVPGWSTQHNRFKEYQEAKDMGKQIKLTKYENGILYGQLTASADAPITVHDTSKRCAPIRSPKTPKAPCVLRHAKKLKVTFHFAIPIRDGLKRCDHEAEMAATK